jgi:hypothetical protein
VRRRDLILLTIDRVAFTVPACWLKNTGLKRSKKWRCNVIFLSLFLPL